MACGVRRISIDGLAPDVSNALIIGVIIAKQRVNKFVSKKDGLERAVWNITIRDSPEDTINCAWWGSTEGAFHYSQMFTIGDVVEITNPKITFTGPGGTANKFKPNVSSAFALEIHEHQGEILPHVEEDSEILSHLMHIPTKASGDYLKLSDVSSYGQSMQGQNVNLLVALTNLEPVRTVTSRKDGATILCRNIVVLDESMRDFRLTIWDEDILHLSDVWRPHDTADVRIQFNSFTKEITVAISSCSIVTVNPKIPEAEGLKSYVKSTPSQPAALLDHLASAIIDVSKIDSVMTTAQLVDKAFSCDNPGGQFTALLYVYVTHLNLDGSDPIMNFKCANCGVIQEEKGLCPNRDCIMLNPAPPQRPEFNIKVDLSDHRGTFSCYLRGNRAAKVLGCTEDMFLALSSERQTERKWKLLLERCEARVIVLCSAPGRGSPLISLLTCQPADPNVVSAKLPIY